MMKNKDNNIDDLFQPLKEHRATAPAGLWECIEQQMDTVRPASGTVWQKWAIAAAILLLLGLGTYIFLQKNDAGSSEANEQVVDSTSVSADDETRGEILETESDNLTGKSKTPIITSNSDFASTANGDIQLDSHEPNNINYSQAHDQNSHITNAKNAALAQTEDSQFNGESGTEVTSKTTVAEANNNSSGDRYNSRDKIKGSVDTSKNTESLNVETNTQIENSFYIGIAANSDSNTDSEGREKIVSNIENAWSTNANKYLPVTIPSELHGSLPINRPFIKQPELDQENQVENLSYRWIISSASGPVLADTFGGSSIHPSFSDNPKNPGINLSYGVNVGYRITERLTLRSGLHNSVMNYSTGDITYTVTTQNETASTQIGSTGNSTSIIVYDRFNPADLSEVDDVRKEFAGGSQTSAFDGEINQRLSYAEVPVEMSYRLMDSKFRLSVIGGFSTLFIQENEIIITDGDNRVSLGQDPTFNDLNFSLNTGLGVAYDLTEYLGLRVEPQFKYQLRAQNNNQADFRPFTIGLQTGLFYRF